ncbi:hypothetical protein GmRootV118_20410 [Variovorax sp. V118]|uniref:hypothetical protein n=1 Tax=Variovorax sp. V118 TaxID=3065954 RepID=UPI0034E841AA
MTTRNLTSADRLRIRLELEAALAKADARLARIDCVLGALEADLRRQRARARVRAEAQAIALEHERAVRRTRLAQGLGVALIGGAAAVFTAASKRHPIGLRELD